MFSLAHFSYRSPAPSFFLPEVGEKTRRVCLHTVLLRCYYSPDTIK